MNVNPDCSAAPQPQHGVVEFDPAAFRKAFPQFTDPPTTDEMLQFYFDLATLVLDNSCKSRVRDAAQRGRLLGLLVAHIATVKPLTGGAGAGGGMVGPISQASEGSASVMSGFAAQVSHSAAWFVQTQFGFMFWQLTSPFRTFQYVTPNTNGVGAYAGRRGY